MKPMHSTDEPIDQQLDAPGGLRLAATSTGAAPPSSPMAPAETRPESNHLVDYLKILHKRRWTAGTAFLIVLA